MLAKIMSSRLLITSILIFIVISSTSCQSNNLTNKVVEDKTIAINLPNPPKDKNVFYENDIARLEISYEDFIIYLETQPNTPSTIERINFINSYFETNSSLNINNSEDLWNLSNLLEAGKVAVYNKNSEVYEDKILIHIYSSICGPTCGAGYRYFYFVGIFNIRSTKFLEISDWEA